MYVWCLEIETYENAEKNIDKKRIQIYQEKTEQMCWEIESYENVEKKRCRDEENPEKTEQMCREKNIRVCFTYN